MKLGLVSIQNSSPKTNPEEVSLRLLEMFIKEVDRHGSKPVVIFFPQQAKTLAKYEQEQFPYYDKFIPVIQNLGAKVIDLDKYFVEAKQIQHDKYEDFFTGGQKGHYNAQGNYVVSQAILDQLCAAGSVADCCRDHNE